MCGVGRSFLECHARMGLRSKLGCFIDDKVA